MDIKIIATDLDGTLLAPDHVSVTPRTMAALTNAHEKGVKIAISTGRTLSLIKEVREKIPFADYIIYSNGAAVYDCKKDQTVYEQPVPDEKTQKIIQILENFSAYYNIYSDGNIYMKKTSDTGVFEKTDLPREFLMHFLETAILKDDMVSEMQSRKAEQIIVYFASDECRNAIYKAVNDLGGLHTVSSFSDNIEIMSDAASKGLAVNAICNILGCTAENAMTFGDAWNDCSMLEFAEHSFAMANGDEKSKLSAKNICPSNADDGVAQMIEKYILNA